MASLLLISSIAAFAQVKVSGVVSDPDGEPLAGATIIEKGTSNGTSTDIDGNYTLNVKEGKTLVFSYIGYDAQEVKAKAGTLNVTLKENSALLDEVVVVGYGTMRRKDVTGSISTVNAKDLNVGAYTDPGQLLQGKVPGLVVVQNSDPNGGVNSITLRGASTLNGSTEPLYVVDGIPGVSLNLVSPSDIESIDVLRDASATAIYGSKAANGVIIITTKHGSDGPARVNYSGYVSWEKTANDHKMMTATQLRNYAADHNITLINDKGADTNWADEVQRTGFAHNHNLSISGGNKSTNYNASINYIERDGTIQRVGNNLLTARTYVETKTLKDHLTLALGVNGNIRNEWGVERSGSGKSVYNAMYYYSPLVPTTDEDGGWYSDKSISQNYNPLSMINEDQSCATLKRLQVTGKVTVKIIEGLLLNANFNYQNKNYAYKDYHSTKSEINTQHGYTSRNTYTDINKMMEIYANYDKTFGTDHKLALMAGYSWEQNDNGEGFGASAYNFYDDTLWWNNIGAANSTETDPIWSNNISTTRMISFYGRANYSWRSKYMFQAAVRRDGASTFGSNHKWATFPSASVAWRASEESFIKNLGIFDDLKVRVGWGQSGNAQGFDIYTSRFYYGTGSRFTYIDADGNESSYKSLTAARNVNDDLKWETTTMLNIGLDFAFLNGRINGSIEYYNKDTKDMIWDYTVSTTRYPVSWITANVGRMKNRGVELSINAVPVQTRDWNWSTSFNFSHNKNKVTCISDPSAGYTAGIINKYNPDLPGVSNTTIQRIIEGQPIGTFYMWEFAGYDENGNSTFYTYNKTNDQTTGERCVDENGNYIVTSTPDEKDRVIVGNAQPWLTMGWDNKITWKNWDLNLFFTGVFGQKIFDEARAYYSYLGNVALGKNVLQSVVTDQNPNDSYSSMPSTRFLEDGSYFKLSTVTLGYTFRNCFNGWLRDLRLYVSCNNVFTITGYKGRDPEINLGGLTPGIDTRSDHFPRTRQVLVGASINF
jgi:iron complex outermembrane receptor protein